MHIKYLALPFVFFTTIALAMEKPEKIQIISGMFVYKVSVEKNDTVVDVKQKVKKELKCSSSGDLVPVNIFYLWRVDRKDALADSQRMTDVIKNHPRKEFAWLQQK